MKAAYTRSCGNVSLGWTVEKLSVSSRYLFYEGSFYGVAAGGSFVCGTVFCLRTRPSRVRTREKDSPVVPILHRLGLKMCT